MREAPSSSSPFSLLFYRIFFFLHLFYSFLEKVNCPPPLPPLFSLGGFWLLAGVGEGVGGRPGSNRF